MANQAQAAWDGMTQSIRQRDAYNALAKIYGPIAGDPVNALRMQSYGYNEQMNPLQIANQQITNQAKQQQTDYLAKSYPLQLTGQDLENQKRQQDIDTTQLSLDGQKALATRSALGGVLSTLGTNDPGDADSRGKLFDAQVAKVAPMIGVDPEDLAGSLGSYRQQYVTAGSQSIPGMSSELESMTLGSMNPVDRAKYLTQLQAARTQQARQQVMGAQGDMMRAHTDLYSAQAAAAKAKAAGGAAAATNPFQDERLNGITGTMDTTTRPGSIGYGDDGAIGKALKYLDQSSDSSIYRGLVQAGAESRIPGVSALASTAGPEYELSQVLDQISHNLPLDDYRSLKAQGGNLGRVTNVEFMALKDALPKLNMARNKDELRSAILNIGGIYSRIQQRIAAEDAAKAQAGGGQPASPGATPAGGPPIPPAGGAPTGAGALAPIPGVDMMPTNSITPAPAASSPAAAAAPPAPTPSAGTPAAQQQFPPAPTGDMAQPAVQRVSLAPTPDTTQSAVQRGSAPMTPSPGMVRPVAEPAPSAIKDIPGLPAPNLKAVPGSVPPAYIYQGLVQRGLSPALAYATLGNWKQESEFKPTALNPGEGAIGFDQWRGGRADALRAFAQQQGKSVNDPDVQMDFYVHELKTGQGLSGRQANAGRAAMAAPDIATANRYLKAYISYGSPPSQGGELTRLANAMGYAKQQLGKEQVAAGTLSPGSNVADAQLRGGLPASAATQPGNSLLPRGGELEPSTAASYQPQQGPQTAPQQPQGGPPQSQPGPALTADANALSTPSQGPLAVTPGGKQVDWETVLPYLPELLAMAHERRTARRG